MKSLDIQSKPGSLAYPRNEIRPFSMEHFTPPPNPIHETNAKLESLIDSSIATNDLLNEYISTSAGLLQTLNGSIRQISGDSAIDAKKTRTQNHIMIFLTVFTLV